MQIIIAIAINGKKPSIGKAENQSFALNIATRKISLGTIALSNQTDVFKITSASKGLANGFALAACCRITDYTRTHRITAAKVAEVI